jgi:hypothetical protein
LSIGCSHGDLHLRKIGQIGDGTRRCAANSLPKDECTGILAVAAANWIKASA